MPYALIESEYKFYFAHNVSCKAQPLVYCVSLCTVQSIGPCHSANFRAGQPKLNFKNLVSMPIMYLLEFSHSEFSYNVDWMLRSKKRKTLKEKLRRH